MSEEARKLSKDELREDEFAEWVMSAADYVRAHYRAFVAGAVVVIVGILGAEYLIRSQARAREEAMARLGEALIVQNEGQDEQARRVLAEVLERFPGTPAAGQATLMLANRHLAAGDYAEARRLFQRYLDDHGDSAAPLVYAARSGLAAVLEAEGQTEAAAAAYWQIAQESRGTAEAAFALWEAAECYGRMGDQQQRRRALEALAREHHDLPLAERARAALAAI